MIKNKLERKENEMETSFDWAELPDWSRLTRANFEWEWPFTEKDDKLHELAKRYHDETEAYDRTVCTGPWKMAAINRNACQVFERIAQEAANYGISRVDLWHAVVRHS